MKALLKRFLAAFAPASMQTVVYGDRPGWLWCQADGAWVPEETSWQPGSQKLSVYGPVYTCTHGHP